LAIKAEEPFMVTVCPLLLFGLLALPAPVRPHAASDRMPAMLAVYGLPARKITEGTAKAK